MIFSKVRFCKTTAIAGRLQQPDHWQLQVHQQQQGSQQQQGGNSSREATTARKLTTAGTLTTSGTARNFGTTSNRRNLNSCREGSHSRDSSHRRHSRYEATAVRTHQQQAPQQHKRQLEHPGAPTTVGNRYVKTGGNIRRRRYAYN